MSQTIPEFDAYIAKSASFAQPILTKIRKLFHKACPEIQERMKWSCPHFEHKGLVGGVAAFKKHVSLSFWKGKLLSDPHELFEGGDKTTMHAIKLTSAADLPPDKVLIAYIKEAVKLNEDGVKAAKPKGKKAAAKLAVPGDLMSALKKNKAALKTFDGFSQSHRNEYIQWVTEAKQEATRQKRIAAAVELMAEGKPRHWKYMKK